MGPFLLPCLDSWTQLVFLLGTQCPRLWGLEGTFIQFVDCTLENETLFLHSIAPEMVLHLHHQQIVLSLSQASASGEGGM